MRTEYPSVILEGRFCCADAETWLTLDCVLLIHRCFRALKSTDMIGGCALTHMRVKLLRDETPKNLSMLELHAQMPSR